VLSWCLARGFGSGNWRRCPNSVHSISLPIHVLRRELRVALRHLQVLVPEALQAPERKKSVEMIPVLAVRGKNISAAISHRQFRAGPSWYVGQLLEKGARRVAHPSATPRRKPWLFRAPTLAAGEGADFDVTLLKLTYRTHASLEPACHPPQPELSRIEGYTLRDTMSHAARIPRPTLACGLHSPRSRLRLLHEVAAMTAFHAHDDDFLYEYQRVSQGLPILRRAAQSRRLHNLLRPIRSAIWQARWLLRRIIEDRR